MTRLLLLFLLFVTASAAYADRPLVAVASNMSHVMEEIVDDYRKTEGKNIKLTFGSSGNFTRQIRQGAPYDIFLSAARNYVDILSERDLLAEKPRPYARGRIGFFIPDKSPLGTATNLNELFNLLQYGDYHRISIANPEYAPYGVATGQALQSGGVWAVPAKKLLIAENAAQVAQYVLSGNVDAGVIPESFSVLPMIKTNGRFLAIPEPWHDPITQYLALLKDAGQSSRDFYNYLTGENALAVLQRSGYSTVDIEEWTGRH